MPPAIIGGAIAAVGAIGGSLLGASAQKSAAKKAAATQNAATDAQLQLGQESLALQRQQAGTSFDLLSPYASRGNVAGDAINSLLGLGAAPKLANPYTSAAAPAPQSAPYTSTPMPTTGTTMPHAYPSANVTGGENIYANSNAPAPSPAAANGARPLLSDYRGNIAGFQDALQGYRAAHPIGTPQVPPVAAGGASAGAPAGNGAAGANSALNNFANSAGMQFQLKQGADMINNQYAARGALQSGAAMKAIQGYGQQTALNNYFMPYMGLLQGQQSTGAQAGAAVAGVGTSFGNTAAGINDSMGNAIGSGAANIMNLQGQNGRNTANMWNNIGQQVGNFGGSLGSSFASPQIPHFVQGTQLPVNF